MHVSPDDFISHVLKSVKPETAAGEREAARALQTRNSACRCDGRSGKDTHTELTGADVKTGNHLL